MMNIPEGATHKMNGSFYIKKEPDFYDIQAGRIPVMFLDGVKWNKAFLNEDAPLVKIEPEPYKPNVGDVVEVFISEKWVRANVYGIGENGECLAKPDDHWYDEFTAERIRPIDSEREQFIKKAQKVMRSELNESKNWIAILYDNGARFNGSDDE